MHGLVAILCSGQGGQHPAMFDLVANCPEAEPIFAAAASVLGQDPRRFVHEAAPAELFSDLSGQILCCTQALAVWEALGTVRPARTVIAGYSVGELAAWGCAGALNGPRTLRLAQRRSDHSTPLRLSPLRSGATSALPTTALGTHAPSVRSDASA